MSENHITTLCFGKLPAFADFVRHNAAGKEIQAFDQWIQEGVQLAKIRLHPNWELAYKRAPGYRFIFPFKENNKSILAGLIQSSVDKIGRTYPFILAMLINKAFLQLECYHIAPVLFKNFIEKAEVFMAEASHEQVLQDIPEKVEALGSNFIQSMNDSINLYNNFKNKTSISLLIKRMSISLDGVFKIQLFENIVKELISLLKYHTPPLNYGLRIPLGNDFQLSIFEATFWIELLGKLFSQNFNVPYLFHTSSGSNKRLYLYLFFNYPSPKSFVNLIQVDLEIDSIYKLDGPDLLKNKHNENIASRGCCNIFDIEQSLNDFLKNF